ncbi:hypothetical protein NMY22_g1323 [Coprinellus aureogranulatus]|nr:hypothetical protein NMY22_g1323 [Coprinellus aureogranulatus]
MFHRQYSQDAPADAGAPPGRVLGQELLPQDSRGWDSDELPTSRLAAIQRKEFQIGIMVLQCLDMVDQLAFLRSNLPVFNPSDIQHWRGLEAVNRTRSIQEPPDYNSSEMLSALGLGDVGVAPHDQVRALGRRFSRQPSALNDIVCRIRESPGAVEAMLPLWRTYIQTHRSQQSDLLTSYPTQLNPPLRTMSSLAAVGLRSARRPVLRNVQTVGRRFAHADPNYNMPFNYTTTSRRAFAVKAFTFMGTAFTIPFIAIWWHWNRPGGIKNPVN